MELPNEIIEKILLYCDGPTLCSALHVNKQWENIVEYVTQKYDIWRKLLLKEVSEYERCYYTTSECKHIYINRVAWMNNPPIEFENKQFEVDQSSTKITSVAVYGNYVAFAQADGRIFLYYKNKLMWNRVDCISIPDAALHFITDKNAVPIALVMVISGVPTIYVLNGKYEVYYMHNSRELLSKLDIYTVCRNYLLELQVGSIFVYEFDPLLCETYSCWPCKIFVQRRFNVDVRVPMYLKMVGERKLMVMGLYEHILVEMEVPNSQPTHDVIQRDMWPTSFNSMINPRKSCLCLLNELDYILCYDDPSAEVQTQLFSLYLNHFYKKMLFPQKVYGALVSCIYLYGNTLVVGTINSSLYFYLIKDNENLNNFELENYCTYYNIGQTFCGVKSIQAIDLDGRREFYVLGRNNNLRVISAKLSQNKTNYGDQIDLK